MHVSMAEVCSHQASNHRARAVITGRAGSNEREESDWTHHRLAVGHEDSPAD